MKHFFLLSISLLMYSFIGCRQSNRAIAEEQPFKISGKIDGDSIDTIVFSYYRCVEGSFVIDTISVVNGNFTIEGIISPYSRAELSINNKSVVFYLDPGEMQLYLKKDSLDSFVLKGSRTQAEKEILELQTKSLEDSLYIIKRQLFSEQDGQNNDFLITQRDSIENLLNDIWTDFVTSHPASYCSVDAIFKILGGNKQNADVIMGLFNGLSENVRLSCPGKQVYNFIHIRKTSTMTNVSSLEAVDKNGTLIKLSDFKGKCILIDFWASWCVPCIKGFPHLKELYARYKDKGLVVFSISVDRKRDEQKWLNAIAEHDNNEWMIHILSCKNQGENNMCNLHDILQDGSIPHYILIDQSGNVIKQWRGFNDEIAKEQDELFQSIFENKQ